LPAQAFLFWMKTIADLPIGASAIIEGFTDEALSLRLLEMGCLPNETVWVAHIAPLGDPIAINVSGYCLALRKSEAATVRVRSC
jgi:ferrous iron transport protein A